MQIDITPSEARFIIDLMSGDKSVICTDLVEKMKAIVVHNEVERELNVYRPVHKWEGEVCDGCRHSSTLHQNNTGICCAPNCDCFKFLPSGKEI